MKPTAPSAEMKRLIESASAAMLRAAQRAREVAALTGTHLIIEEDGKLQRFAVERDGRLVPATISQSEKPEK